MAALFQRCRHLHRFQGKSGLRMVPCDLNRDVDAVAGLVGITRRQSGLSWS